MCGLIINWSDQPYADSKLQCHCERKDLTVDAYIIDHIVYNMYFKEETLIGNILPKVIFSVIPIMMSCEIVKQKLIPFFGK